MVHDKRDKQPLSNEMDQWLENFFLDPLTSYFDEVAFRIDLFETAEEYIVEAIIPDDKMREMEIYLESNTMRIQLHMENIKNEIKQRMIPFPFPVIKHEVTAELHDDVLEVFIAKNKFCEGKNRKILITK